LAQHDYRLAKVRARSWLPRERGIGYMITDYRNNVVAGCCQHEYDASLEDVEAFAAKHC
jgi:hypothetical protein